MKPAIALMFLGLLVGQPSQDEPSKLADLHIQDSFLSVEGVWRADNLTEKTEAAFDSVTRLECYKNGGMLLVGSDAYCMQATATISSGGFPSIEVAYYPVIAWNKDKVIAADSSTAAFPICVWTQVTVDLHDHSVMATDTRKLGKGHEGFHNVCQDMPLAQTYHLMDSLQEFTRRRLRAWKKGKEAK